MPFGTVKNENRDQMIASIQGRSNLNYPTMYSSRSVFACPLHLNAAHLPFGPVIHSFRKIHSSSSSSPFTSSRSFSFGTAPPFVALAAAAGPPLLLVFSAGSSASASPSSSSSSSSTGAGSSSSSSPSASSSSISGSSLAGAVLRFLVAGGAGEVESKRQPCDK